MKTLYDFFTEMETLSFDKKKVQGLVKRANSGGYDIYYAYHEDGENTWVNGWSSEYYKNDENDCLLFLATNLIQKKKPTFRSFSKAQTYTAECAIFIFCPLSTLLNDSIMRENKIESVKNKAAKYAESDYLRAIERLAKFEKWMQLPEENKIEISKLDKEQFANVGEFGTAKMHTQFKKEKEDKIRELGGRCYPLADWQNLALSFSLAGYIEYKQNKAIESLLKETEPVNNIN